MTQKHASNLSEACLSFKIKNNKECGLKGLLHQSLQLHHYLQELLRREKVNCQHHKTLSEEL